MYNKRLSYVFPIYHDRAYNTASPLLKNTKYNLTKNPKFYMYNLPHISIGVECPSDPDVVQATNQTEGTLFGDTVLYTCNHGFVFPHTGNVSLRIHCLGDRQWSEIPPACESKA